MAQHLTRDHETIRRWAEERGGRPATTAALGTRQEPGLHIHFPGQTDIAVPIQEIGWVEWFRKFDESNLVLLYQEQTADRRPSIFNRLVPAEAASIAASAQRVPPAPIPTRALPGDEADPL